MAQPTTRDVHVDVALSQISIGYRNANYIADQIFPIVRVQKQSDKYYVWTKDFWFRSHVQPRTPGDTYPEGGLELSTASYFCNIYHLAFPLPDETLENQDPAVDLAAAGAEWLADQFLLHRETKFVADFFKTGVWDTDVTLSGTNQWSDFANSDPISDIKTGKQTIHKNTGAEANVLVVGREVLDKLAEHPLLLEKYKYTGVPILSAEQVARALEVDKILVGNAIENTAQEGATFSGGYVWGKNALLLHVAQRPGLMVPSAGYTFLWPIKGGDLDIQVTRVRDEMRDRDVLRAKVAWDQKVTASDLGYFLSSVIA